MKIEKLIKDNQGGVVLFLGRVTNFTPQELSNFLEEQGMRYADKYEGQDVAFLVLSSMLSPIEEQLSYDLYDAKIADVTLGSFEQYYTIHIKPNTLLMSLKLSNDQERLKRLLDNSAFEDEVYLKLFKLYDWQGEGIHDNNENRDVTISFVKRFYKPDGFRDPAMIYAPTTVMNIAQDSRDSAVLDAILTMPNHEIKVSRRDTHRPRSLREFVAINEVISQDSIKKILSFRDDKATDFLALNPSLLSIHQEQIFDNSTEQTKLMLAHNDALSDNLFEKLLDSTDEVVKTLLSYQRLDSSRWDTVLSKNIDSEIVAYVGDNATVAEIIDSLFALDNQKLDFRLASNSVTSAIYLEKLYEKYSDSLAIDLCKNPNLPTLMIEMFYAKRDGDIVAVLATNPSTPKKILSELCQREDRELNKLLATNSSVDLYYLQQFQLDPSLIMILAKNETYGNHILNNLGI